MNNKKQEHYSAPAVEVVKLQAQGTLLEGSGEEGTKAMRESYSTRQDMAEWK